MQRQERSGLRLSRRPCCTRGSAPPSKTSHHPARIDRPKRVASRAAAGREAVHVLDRAGHHAVAGQHVGQAQAQLREAVDPSRRRRRPACARRCALRDLAVGLVGGIARAAAPGLGAHGPAAVRDAPSRSPCWNSQGGCASSRLSGPSTCSTWERYRFSAARRLTPLSLSNSAGSHSSPRPLISNSSPRVVAWPMFIGPARPSAASG